VNVYETVDHRVNNAKSDLRNKMFYGKVNLELKNPTGKKTKTGKSCAQYSPELEF